MHAVKYCLLNSHEIWIIRVIWYRKPKSPQISPRRKFLPIPDVVHFPMVLHKEKNMMSIEIGKLKISLPTVVVAYLPSTLLTIVVGLYFLKWYSNRKKTLNEH